LKLTEIDFQELKKHLLKKEPQNVYDLCDRYQLDVVTRVFFGKSSDSLSTVSQTFREAMEVVFGLNTKRAFLGLVSPLTSACMISICLANIHPRPIGVYLPMNLIAGKSLKVLNDYIQTFVDRTLSLALADLKAIPGKDRNLAQSLAVEESDAKACIRSRRL
jgi:hypothetical protein